MLFHKYVFFISCYPWRTHRFIPYFYSFLSYQIKYNLNSTLVVEKFGCLVNLTTLLVGCLGVFIFKGLYLRGSEEKQGRFKVLDCKVWLEYIFCFCYLHNTAILWNYTQSILGSMWLSRHNHTPMVSKVGCLVYMVDLLVGCLLGSVLKFNLAVVVNKKGGTSGFVLKVILGGSLFV